MQFDFDERAIVGALDRSEYIPYLQPFVHLATNTVIGGELLVRWDHPEHGILLPLTFLPALEASGRLPQLTDHMLDSASRLLKGGRLVSVNLGQNDLSDRELPARVRAALSRNGAEVTGLCVEVLETNMSAGSIENLMELNSWGVQVAVDDFGTEYSSLARVIDLQADIVKLDRSLIQTIDQRPRTQVVLQSFTEAMHGLGTIVLAEGVEEDAELATLTELGIDLAQGYALGRPVKAAAIAAAFNDPAHLDLARWTEIAPSP